MTENRLSFLQDTFVELEIQFSDDFSNAVIVNPNYKENIIVYDEGYEYIVCFSFQHCHFEDTEDVVEWIHEIIAGSTLAIEFFCKEKRCFGGEIDAEELQDLSYDKLQQLWGFTGFTKLLDTADSFKVRGWDSKSNFDFTFIYRADKTIEISKAFVGML